MKRTDWTKAEIRTMLESDNIWLCRGLVAIFDKQTAEEQRDGRTEVDNGIGFNGVDAEILTNFALRIKNPERGFLSAKQLPIARKKMLKYAGQLCKIANGDV